ncbi:MAG: hypothetical protein V3T72_13895 [Thermoanaerobaculia bacterium]
MTRIQTFLLLSTLTIVLVSTACQRGEIEELTPEAESTAAESTVVPDAAADVAYEPAYPADVSTEDLSEEDEDQQEAGHPHGDGDHDDASHPHGDGDHDQDDASQTHGDEDHDHDE